MHWLARHRIWALAVVCAFCTALVVFSAPIFPHLPFVSGVWTGERNFEDLLQREGRKTPARADFIFLGIDQSTLEPSFLPEEIAGNRALQLMTERAFPWSREIWALLLDRLFASGARLVMFDMVFSPPNDGDSAFHDALERYRDRVIVGANFDMQNNAQLVVPNSILIPPPQIRDDRVGYVNFFADDDGKVRRAQFTMTDRQLAGLAPHASEITFDSFAARVLQKLGHAADVPRDNHPHQIRFASSDAYPMHPLWEVLDPKTWQANYRAGAVFKDKAVIIGPAAQVQHDVVSTPTGEMQGPVLHLQAVSAGLAHEYLRNTSDALDVALVCCAGAVAWLLITFVRRPLISIALLLGIAVLYLAVSRIAYDRAGLLLCVVPPMTTFLAGGALSVAYDYIMERRERARTRRTLERYVSKNLVKEILDNPGSFYSSLRGVRIPATVLFSDIIGFTTRTESADPEALVRQLNEYLSRMTAAVFEHGGTLDKFIGDAVMAVWGNVSSRGKVEDAKACARAALVMRRELLALNQGWQKQGIAPFAIGMGINHGDVLGANIGSQEKADPTVIGDAVNLASRLEALTRIYGVDILVGESAAELIRDGFHLRSVARAQVKGKTLPVEVFTLIGERDQGEDSELLKWLTTYEEALQKFRARDFNQAKILLSRFLEFYPDDYLAKMYFDRALEYELAPPNEQWNAVEVFQKK